MSDLISRQKAVDAIHKEFDEVCVWDESGQTTANEVENILYEVPSVEPERKKGRWQRRKGSDCWECSECHAILESDDIVRHNYYYCYHCGADMMNEDGYMNLEGTEHE